MKEGFEAIYSRKAGRMSVIGAVIALAAVLAVTSLILIRNNSDSPTASADSLSAPLSAPSAAGFIQIEGILGESDDKVHEGWIELESFSHSVSAPTMSEGGAGGISSSGPPTIRDFVITKKVDRSSPLLMEHALTGNAIPLMTFEVTRAGQGPFTYLRYEFEDVIITNYRVSGASSGDVPPTESISFTFTTIKVTYNPQNEDGSAGEPVETGWDLKQNVKF